jgi:hypothetical protein
MTRKTRKKTFVDYVVNSILKMKKIKDRRTEEREWKKEKSFEKVFLWQSTLFSSFWDQRSLLYRFLP